MCPTPEGARQAKRAVRKQAAATATESSAAASRKLADSLPAEGRIRHLVAAWLDVSEQQARAAAAQSDLLDSALSELAQWADPTSVEARLGEVRAQVEAAHAQVARSEGDRLAALADRDIARATAEQAEADRDTARAE
ncbi:MAG: hypothetical protein WCF36_08225, partial [Candidatus Nanopelagicales bacterium]